MLGKSKRLSRIFNDCGNIIITPLDHGITVGPIDGLENTKRTLKEIVDLPVDSIIAHKGVIRQNYDLLSGREVGLIMHLSCSTTIGGFDLKKIRSASVDEAVAMGCDGVSIHVNLGNDSEGYMLEDFANISEECSRKGMPLIAMMYARGPEIENECDVKYVKHIARVAEELGADIVKVNYTGDIKGFKEVVEGCQIPIVIAGGEKQDNIKTLIMINDAMEAGARGISIGRNIFQQKDKKLMLKAIREIVYHRTDINTVIDRYIRLQELSREVAITL